VVPRIADQLGPQQDIAQEIHWRDLDQLGAKVHRHGQTTCHAHVVEERQPAHHHVGMSAGCMGRGSLLSLFAEWSSQRRAPNLRFITPPLNEAARLVAHKHVSVGCAAQIASTPRCRGIPFPRIRIRRQAMYQFCISVNRVDKETSSYPISRDDEIWVCPRCGRQRRSAYSQRRSGLSRGLGY
jgi:hypothetical protein